LEIFVQINPSEMRRDSDEIKRMGRGEETYEITVTVRLTIRASAILVAPSSPISFPLNLREGDENEEREGRKEKGRDGLVEREERNLPNLCHCAVDHQSFGDLGRSLVSDIIIIQPEKRR
jgi:hypothetical protein